MQKPAAGCAGCQAGCVVGVWARKPTTKGSRNEEIISICCDDGAPYGHRHSTHGAGPPVFVLRADQRQRGSNEPRALRHAAGCGGGLCEHHGPAVHQRNGRHGGLQPLVENGHELQQLCPRPHLAAGGRPAGSHVGCRQFGHGLHGGVGHTIFAGAHKQAFCPAGRGAEPRRLPRRASRQHCAGHS